MLKVSGTGSQTLGVGMNMVHQSGSEGKEDAVAGDPHSAVKLHSILCNRTSAWASRIYENIGSEASSMQKAEMTLRQALNAMPAGEDSGADLDEEECEESEAAATLKPEGGEAEKTETSEAMASVQESEERCHISWKCGVCGYHVLAMDQNGNPLPLSRGAYGELLPIRCPQCEMEHTSWEQAIPFDKHGDHVNIRSTLSNNYVTQCRKKDLPSITTSPSTMAPSHHSSAPMQPELPPILANIGRVTYKDGVAIPNIHIQPRQTPEVRMAFYCTHCGRRLLRVDSEGELVAMDKDARGEVLPIRCPGCGEVHNRWEVKPFTVGRMNLSGKGVHHDGKGKTPPVQTSCVEPLPNW